MMRKATNDASKRSMGIAGSANTTTDSSTPRPPGTLVIMTATTLSTYTARNAWYEIAAVPGSNTYKHSAARHKSTAATATCISVKLRLGNDNDQLCHTKGASR